MAMVMTRQTPVVDVEALARAKALATIGAQLVPAAVVAGVSGVVMLATDRKKHPWVWWGVGGIFFGWNVFRVGMALWARSKQ